MLEIIQKDLTATNAISCLQSCNSTALKSLFPCFILQWNTRHTCGNQGKQGVSVFVTHTRGLPLLELITSSQFPLHLCEIIHFISARHLHVILLLPSCCCIVFFPRLVLIYANHEFAVLHRVFFKDIFCYYISQGHVLGLNFEHGYLYYHKKRNSNGWHLVLFSPAGLPGSQNLIKYQWIKNVKKETSYCNNNIYNE